MSGINNNDFCRAANNALAEYGVFEDDLLFCCGDMVLPVSPTDPYAMRRYVLITTIREDGGVDIESQPMLVDGSGLVRVDDDENRALFDKLQVQLSTEYPEQGEEDAKPSLLN
jgi:hypothetical protein